MTEAQKPHRLPDVPKGAFSKVLEESEAAERSQHSERIRQTLAFMESTIKSGEGYTETVVLETSEALAALDSLVEQYQALRRAAQEFHVSYLQASAADEEGLLVNEDYEAYRALWRQVDETADAVDHLLSNPSSEPRDLDQGRSLQEQYRALRDIAQRFVDKYPGNQAGVLGNGAARRALDEFREALNPATEGPVLRTPSAGSHGSASPSVPNPAKDSDA